MTPAADRQLLFGLLALQNGIINQGQLVAAFQAWTLDKSKSLADHLEARGELTGAKRALLEGLADVHLDAHGGDVEKSLAAISAGRSTKESLARIGSPEINATLGHVASAQAARLTTTVTPNALEPIPWARPPATASGSACSGRMPAEAWGPCSWRSMAS